MRCLLLLECKSIFWQTYLYYNMVAHFDRFFIIFPKKCWPVLFVLNKKLEYSPREWPLVFKPLSILFAGLISLFCPCRKLFFRSFFSLHHVNSALMISPICKALFKLYWSLLFFLTSFSRNYYLEKSDNKFSCLIEKVFLMWYFVKLSF